VLPALLALAAAVAPSTLEAQDAAAVVRRAGAVYRSLNALQADFVQTIEDGQVGDTLHSTGRLYQAGPNAFAMRFSDPPDEAIVIDGTYIWIYTPSAAPGQVIRMRMETDPVYGVNLLAKLLDRPTERYRTGWVKADTLGGRRMDVVAIVPRGDNQQFTRAVLWLDAVDALPRRIELEEAPGVRRILVLSRLRPGASIPRTTFEFRPPRGVRVVDR
jgi:outer membrane lipoprotein carrier protein